MPLCLGLDLKIGMVCERLRLNTPFNFGALVLAALVFGNMGNILALF